MYGIYGSTRLVHTLPDLGYPFVPLWRSQLISFIMKYGTHVATKYPTCLRRRTPEIRTEQAAGGRPLVQPLSRYGATIDSEVGEYVCRYEVVVRRSHSAIAGDGRRTTDNIECSNKQKRLGRGWTDGRRIISQIRHPRL